VHAGAEPAGAIETSGSEVLLKRKSQTWLENQMSARDVVNYNP
jgi:hypothetical protein